MMMSVEAWSTQLFYSVSTGAGFMSRTFRVSVECLGATKPILLQV